jgi:hypothetical protein
MTDRPSDTKRPPIRRVVLILLAVFTAWHIFATFLWIAPASGLRQILPGDLLRGYMVPMFGQSWSVFAPEPINGDHRLRVRAVVIQDGQPKTSNWVDATAAELAMSTHHLFPPRAAVLATELASEYKGAYDDLGDAQHRIAALSYYKGADWAERLQDDLRKQSNDPDLPDYMAAERRVTAYATQVAYAVWPGELVRVQFEVSRQNVIPFDRRNDPDARRPRPKIVKTGWRGVVEEPGQSRAAFAETFRKGLRESGQ